ncbi:hypothetical protein NFI96_020365 [Prochilodus magdalenae]|nr:hypothetical protein NFI96_020365 [Prochilodus magdalenae]
MKSRQTASKTSQRLCRSNHVTLASLTLTSLNSSASPAVVIHAVPDPFPLASPSRPNVCALQQVVGTKKKYFSTCRNWYQGAICGKKATVLYECCPGYMKLEGMRGCPAVAPIDNVYGTLGLVNAITTQQYSALSKLKEEIEGSGSYTFFAPSNEAWDLLDTEVRNALVSNVNIELYNALHYHMINKRLLTKDLRNGLTVSSMYNDLNLHINHYPNGVVTVNCARIIHGNQVATNGVVHVIDRVITAVGNTIQDVIEVDDELSSLSTIATASGLMDKLGQPGHYTLFAPTTDAYNKLDGVHMVRLMADMVSEDAGNSCRFYYPMRIGSVRVFAFYRSLVSRLTGTSESSTWSQAVDRHALTRPKGSQGHLELMTLLNYHLLDSVQCSEAIMTGTSYETLEGTNIEIGCDGDSLTVNGVKMVLKKDIVTTNGVIHLIDEVLMPDSAKQVMELVGQSQSTFSDMVSELGLAAAMRPQAEYTLLVPLNVAFNAPSAERLAPRRTTCTQTVYTRLSFNTTSRPPSQDCKWCPYTDCHGVDSELAAGSSSVDESRFSSWCKTPNESVGVEATWYTATKMTVCCPTRPEDLVSLTPPPYLHHRAGTV